MSDTSRKKKRKEKQYFEKKRSIKLLKTVLLPLLLLLAVVFLIYGMNQTDDQLSFEPTRKQENRLIIKEKKYVDVFTWEELIEAISTKEITEINIKKAIIFPQSQSSLTLNQVTEIREEKISSSDNALKEEDEQTVLIVHLIRRNLERKVIIRGEKRTIDLGKVELELPKGLELEFKEITLLRSFQ